MLANRNRVNPRGPTILGIRVHRAFMCTTSQSSQRLGHYRYDGNSARATPKSATITYEETAKGIKTGESVDAEGKTTSFEYTARYDGKEYPVTGSDLYDTITTNRINHQAALATLKKSGKVVSKVRSGH